MYKISQANKNHKHSASRMPACIIITFIVQHLNCQPPPSSLGGSNMKETAKIQQDYTVMLT